MPPNVQWFYPDKTCVLIEFNEQITWEAFHASINQAHEFIASVPHTVHLIIWDHIGLPRGNPMAHFKTAFQKQPANTGKIIVIPAERNASVTSFIKQLASIFNKVFPTNSPVEFSSSIEQAQNIIQQASQTQTDEH